MLYSVSVRASHGPKLGGGGEGGGIGPWRQKPFGDDSFHDTPTAVILKAKVIERYVPCPPMARGDTALV